jgi:hypothetical protein
MPISNPTAGQLLDHSFQVLDVEFVLRSDDQSLLDEFRRVFDTGDLNSAPRKRLIATVASDRDSGTVTITGDELESPADFLLGFSSPTVPIREVPSHKPGWRMLTVGDETEPFFRVGTDMCEFRKNARWQRILSHYLFLRALRLRSDLLLFHAGSVGLRELGMLIVGPKGSGKTTLSLSLASRGWTFLGDELAAYDPATRMLLPFRRPVGIKPGPRAHKVDSALRERRFEGDEDGIVHVPLEQLLPVEGSSGLALQVVIFLRGFGPAPELSDIAAGREELSILQPIATSLTSVPPTKRVFEMVKLLSSVRTCQLVSADPDQTADLIERTFQA